MWECPASSPLSSAYLDILAEYSLLILEGLYGSLILVEEGAKLHPVLLPAREDAADAHPATGRKYL